MGLAARLAEQRPRRSYRGANRSLLRRATGSARTAGPVSELRTPLRLQDRLGITASNTRQGHAHSRAEAETGLALLSVYSTTEGLLRAGLATCPSSSSSRSPLAPAAGRHCTANQQPIYHTH